MHPLGRPSPPTFPSRACRACLAAAPPRCLIHGRVFLLAALVGLQQLLRHELRVSVCEGERAQALKVLMLS